MELARHCELCDHQKVSLKEGTTCGLTDRKPAFNNTCIKIELKEKFENKLKLINIHFEELKQAKILTYIYFVVFLIIGLAVLLVGYFLGELAINKGVFSTLPVPLIIMGVGIIPLGMAFGTLNNYKQRMKVAKRKKDRIDEVLKAYRIEYDIEIEFGKEYHGTQDVSAILKLKGMY